MKPTEVQEALETARHIAREAGALVHEGFRAAGDIQKKGPIELVTEQDYASERHIRDRLARAFPDHRIVGEEGEARDIRPTGDECVWYVDPLDGTNDFARGHPFFCVSIALYRGAEGIVGAVEAPALGVRWSAARGLGSYRNDRRCHVSQTEALADAMCATGFPYDKWDNPDDNLREFGAFLKNTAGLRRCGSAAIDLAMVADGTYDIYWEQRLHAWDMAAGALLVREAGGRVSDYDGNEGDPRRGRLLATNGRLHDRAFAVLRQARRDL